MYGAMGLIELRGMVPAIAVLDSMLKNSNVEYVGSQKALGAGLVTLMVKGGTDAVNAAIETGVKIGNVESEVISAKVITRPHPEIIGYIDKHYSDGPTQDIFSSSEMVPDKKEALGLIEVYGLVTAIIAADAAAKASPVRIIGIETTKGKAGTLGLVVIVKLVGEAASVGCAVQAGRNAAMKVGEVIATHVNPGFDPGSRNMVQLSNI